MAEMINCPKCKASVPKKPVCSECGFDMKAYFLARKKRQASIICPKCEATVPRKPICAGCGFDMKAHIMALKQKKARKTAMTQKAAPEQKAAAAPAAEVQQAAEVSEAGGLFSMSLEVFKKRWLTLVVILLSVIAVSVLALTAGKGAMDQFIAAFEGGQVVKTQDARPGVFKGKGGKGGQDGQSGVGASLSIPGNSFQPDQEIVVTFSASSSYPSDAWVGIIASNVPHGSVSEKDRFQYLNRRTSGTMTFSAPSSPGGYDLRMYDTDSGGKEVASVSFVVSGVVSESARAPAVALSDVALATTKDRYRENEGITIEYSGFPGSPQDWITLVDAGASDETYGQWFYTEGKTSGTYAFSGEGAGAYELRGYFDYPSGGYTVQSRHAFTVGGGASSGGQAAANWSRSGKSGATGEATIVLDGNIEQYELRTGFFSGTKFDEPGRAKVQFQIEIPGGDEFAVGDRIEMVLDATRRGRHYVDGQAVADSFMGEDRVNVGNPGAQGFEAKLQWVADGGQIYFPKGECYINVDQAYTGGADSVFSGSISDCTVHSAGIDKHIMSFSFTMRGQPES
ncbi:MAG: hypothetical protein KAR83_00705 [Thermodesulfovibrionales bacterium]|nr:hypothetical protein [Thermodesulfovibrionales bacterium]